MHACMHGASMQVGDESMFMAEDGDVGEEVAPPGAGLGASSASVGAAGGDDVGAEAAAAVKSKFRRAAPRAAAGAQKGLAVRSAFKSPCFQDNGLQCLFFWSILAGLLMCMLPCVH